MTQLTYTVLYSVECHSVSFVMYISGAKFEEHCSNTSRYILDSVFYSFYDVITFLSCIIQKDK